MRGGSQEGGGAILTKWSVGSWSVLDPLKGKEQQKQSVGLYLLLLDSVLLHGGYQGLKRS